MTAQQLYEHLHAMGEFARRAREVCVARKQPEQHPTGYGMNYPATEIVRGNSNVVTFVLGFDDHGACGDGTGVR